MSDDEQYSSEEEVEEQEEEEEKEATPEPPKEEDRPAPKAPAQEDEGPSEAELVMMRRKEGRKGVDDDLLLELQQAREEEKAREESAISALKEKQARRKQERIEEEKRLAELRVQEEAKRRAEEEERKRKKEEDERSKRQNRDKQRIERERMMAAIGKPNFVIVKRSGSSSEAAETEEPVTKSREQLEEEKQAILAQRTPKLDTSGFTLESYIEKAKELHSLILRLESEKYDLEERFKTQQYDMMELAERARQLSKGGKAKPGGGRQQQEEKSFDALADKFASAPPKIEMYSKYERQKDKRSYGQRKEIFYGPNWAEDIQKIRPTKTIKFFSDQGPEVIEFDEVADEPAAAPAEAAEEEE